jgi:hypothetical protein
MSQRPKRVFVALLIAFVTFGAWSCSTAPYRYEPLGSIGMLQRAQEQQQGAFTVRATVPSKEESERILGIPIYDRGIQPVWIEITNADDARARVVLSSIDREYFPPYEVAYMHKKRFSAQGWRDMEEYLYGHALPRQIGPGATESGFVFTHASAGTKGFNLDIFGTGKGGSYEQFTFFIDVPGFVPDHREVDFRNLYALSEISKVDKDGLRQLLAEVPWRTQNVDGSASGRPIQLFFVAGGLDMLRALLRAGWNESSYQRDDTYLAGADYLYGRPPDAILRKGRDATSSRAELALWMAPVLVEGDPLWVGLFKHAIGRRYAIGELFFGVTLDPDTIEGRNYVLQDLWYAQAVRHWGWSKTGQFVSEQTPEQDFHGNPWFSKDSERSVIWVSGEPTAMSSATPVDWGRHAEIAGETP